MSHQNKSAYADRLDCEYEFEKVGKDLWFIFITLFIGWTLRLVSINSSLSKIPFTVGLMGLGIFIAFISNAYTCMLGCSPMQNLVMVAHPKNLNGHMILNIFLPVLLFESAFDMDNHLFLRGIREIILLAVPGLLLSTCLSGIFSKIIFSSFSNFDSWPLCFMFGALISATDPVAVVSLLKEIGGSKILGVMIEGEALLNDGAAIVVFEIAKTLAGIQPYINHGHGAHGDDHSASSLSVNSSGLTDSMYYYDARADAPDNVTFTATGADTTGDIIGQICIQIFLKVLIPVAYGCLIGRLTSSMLYKVFDDMLIEVSFPLIMCYVVYYSSEVLEGSGVLACVVFGISLFAFADCL